MAKKEILTMELIKEDLKQHLLSGIPGSILIVFLLAGIYVMCVLAIPQFIDFTGTPKLIFTIVYVACFLLVLVYEFANLVASLIAISKNKIQITSDWVTDMLPMLRSPKLGRSRPYTLVFANSGKYGIPIGENYWWSNKYAMNDIQVYEGTSLNDDFYLIHVGRRKNMLAYNKEWFELKE